MAIGAVASCVKTDFNKYVDSLKPFLLDGLRNTFEAQVRSNLCSFSLFLIDAQVCQVSVGVLGDICRALGPLIAPHCDEFVNVLLIDLSNPNLERSVNPHIIACFGDVALALKGILVFRFVFA
jgi:importin subunit beta-1